MIEQQSLAVPGIFKYPATLLCCGEKRRVECFVATLALWVGLVTLQLVLLQVAAIAFVVSVAPFAVVTNVMLVLLASCSFTCSEMVCNKRTKHRERLHSREQDDLHPNTQQLHCICHVVHVCVVLFTSDL